MATFNTTNTRTVNHKKKDGKVIRYTLTANAGDIKQGDIIQVVAAGTAEPLCTVGSMAADSVFVGTAIENASYSGGDRYIRVDNSGIRYFQYIPGTGGAAATDIGLIVYGDSAVTSNAQGVTPTKPTLELKVGMIVEVVSATEVGVLLIVDGSPTVAG